MTAVDLFVIGSGPAGQKAAIQAAKAGRSVVLCEQLRQVGGACVHQGTIPSKALRERALAYARAGQLIEERQGRAAGSVQHLIGEMGEIILAHDRYMSAQLERNSVQVVHGRATFRTPHHLEVAASDGERLNFEAAHVLIATGSRPRLPDNVPVDHEHVYDSDSILSLAYLPETMVVLGGGVIACEYASIFSLLGVRVTLVDRFERPLGFLDTDLTGRFIQAFEASGGTVVGRASVTNVTFDGISQLTVALEDGRTLSCHKVLCALGRVAEVRALQLDRCGVEVNDRGLIDVDAVGRTNVPHIYAAGDVIGPPSLASASMEQGRRAACHMFGLDPGKGALWIPSGIYAIPEIASVGLTEAQCREQFGEAVVGLADYSEIARGHIAQSSGLLKLVVSPRDRRVRGVHIVGDQATELIHIGQMALIQGAELAIFIENFFNFPTYAESYRVAALSALAGVRSFQAEPVEKPASA